MENTKVIRALAQKPFVRQSWATIVIGTAAVLFQGKNNVATELKA
jgi:hypothetical protein